jgi:hypothetical protein
MKPKLNLTKAEQRNNSAMIERFKRAGIPTGIDAAVSLSPSEILPVTLEPSHPGELMAGFTKGMILIIPLRLMSTRKGIILSEYEIAVAGCDAQFSLCSMDEKSASYRPFGRINIAKDMVLNDLILSERPLPVDLQGSLIAESFDSFTRRFENGTAVKATVELFDGFGKSCESEVSLKLKWRELCRRGRSSGGERPGVTTSVLKTGSCIREQTDDKRN